MSNEHERFEIGRIFLLQNVIGVRIQFRFHDVR
jgi:hypothetical protein